MEDGVRVVHARRCWCISELAKGDVVHEHPGEEDAEGAPDGATNYNADITMMMTTNAGCRRSSSGRASRGGV